MRFRRSRRFVQKRTLHAAANHGGERASYLPLKNEKYTSNHALYAR
jgi:hypothetical protein